MGFAFLCRHAANECRGCGPLLVLMGCCGVRTDGRVRVRVGINKNCDTCV